MTNEHSPTHGISHLATFAYAASSAWSPLFLQGTPPNSYSSYKAQIPCLHLQEVFPGHSAKSTVTTTTPDSPVYLSLCPRMGPVTGIRTWQPWLLWAIGSVLDPS